MDVVVFANGDYERYEELVLQKEQLEREAMYYDLVYQREFGELEIEAFELKIDCIRLKKQLTYCQKLINYGVQIDEEEMYETIEKQMRAYHMQLEEKVYSFEFSKNTKPVSAYEAREVKKIYRRIAKMLHPDINSLTLDHEELAELFHRATLAYRMNSLQKLRETEALINRCLADLGIDRIESSFPNIEESIMLVEQDIDYILDNEPYTYKDLLEDEERVEAIKESLRKEIADFTAYRERLNNALETILEGGEIDWKTILE